MKKIYTYKKKQNSRKNPKKTRKINKKTPLFDASKIHPASINLNKKI